MPKDAYGTITAQLPGNSDRNGMLNRIKALRPCDRAVLVVTLDAGLDDEETLVDTYGGLSLREHIEVLGAGLSELANRAL
jgi:hypothetical protein